jgi:hypothetical protein
MIKADARARTDMSILCAIAFVDFCVIESTLPAGYEYRWKRKCAHKARCQVLLAIIAIEKKKMLGATILGRSCFFRNYWSTFLHFGAYPKQHEAVLHILWTLDGSFHLYKLPNQKLPGIFDINFWLVFKKSAGVFFVSFYIKFTLVVKEWICNNFKQF